MKIKNIVLLILFLVLGFVSCNNDDDGDSSVVARDRGEQYEADLDSIEQYLATHFYNYEEFEADPTSSTFQVVIDTIAGLNSDKTPLIDQVSYKMVTDTEDEDVVYKLYYLKVREGLGENPTFGDSTYVTYSGKMINDEDVFDSTITGTWQQLPYSIHGYREIMVEFNGASDFVDNGDGTVTFENFGVGAMFIPSGLGYFEGTAPGNSYASLVFTFSLFGVNSADTDGDGLLNIYEDIDDDRYLFNDDSDEDIVSNFLDVDDDGDGLLTRDELDFNEYVINIGENDPTFATNELEIDRVIDENEGTITIDTVVILDFDDDGTPDYLDENTTIEEE